MSVLPSATWRFLPPRRRCVRSVLYHHVGDDHPCISGIGVRIRPEEFARHVARLVREYTPVTMRQVLEGDLPPRPLLVTFDDCYRSVLEVAAPVLRAHRVPATLFLTTGPVFRGRALLDHVASLAEVETRGNLASLLAGTRFAGRPEIRTASDLLLGACPAIGSADRRELAEAIAARLGTSLEELVRQSNLFLRPDDLPRLVEAGFEFGGHTDTHVHVRALSEAELGPELVQPAATIAAAIGRPVDTFSYPFGSAVDHTAAAAMALASGGCRATFLVEGAANVRNPGSTFYRSSVAKMDNREAIVELEVLARLRAMRKGPPVARRS
jgi:peptidoglycan/xylan/chitin deacetylase (PgdA/CDA1 family)